MRFLKAMWRFATYVRLWTFQWLLVPISRRSRRARMRRFVEIMGVKAHDRILDLGGHPEIWSYVDIPLDITILNLPGAVEAKDSGFHRIVYVEGDACDVKEFARGDFDIVYSNSVIEHVGATNKQLDFAAVVRRLSSRFWVQTPSKWFPIEAHCGMPFWWFYPDALRKWLLRRWRRNLPAWTEMVEGTTVLERNFLKQLFGGAEIYTERLLGIPKSYTAWSNDVGSSGH